MERLLTTLAAFRSAALRRAAAEALLVGAVAALAILAVASAVLGWVHASDAVRVAALVVAPLVVASLLFWRLGTIARLFHRPEAVAEYLERQLPAFRTDLRTALEFAELPAPADPVAQTLRVSLLSRIDRSVGTMRPAIVGCVPRRELRGVSGALSLGLIVCAGLVAGSPDGFRAGAAMLINGVPVEDDSGNVISERPLVGTVDYEVVAPAYAGRAVRRVFGSTGDIEALAGSEITIQARALDPVADAVLRIDHDGETQRIQLEVARNVRIAGRFTVPGDATYRFELRGTDGEELVDPTSRRIRVIPDAAPSVQLTTPTEQLAVTPDQIVDFQYIARDDFGLSAISAVWYFAGQEDDRREVPLQGSVGATSFEEHVPFDLQPLHLQPRDEIVVFIEALDNDPISGAKAGRSRAVSLRVDSPDDRNLEVLALKEELFESLLRQLAGILESGVVAHELDPESRGIRLTAARGAPEELSALIRSAKEVHSRWLPVARMFESLLALMAEDELTIEADVEMLQGSYDQLYAAVLDEGRALDGIKPADLEAGVARPDFAPAALRTASTLRKTERTILILEDLVATHKADNVQRAMEELSAARDRLQELLEQYRDTDDPALREQIERELRRLEQRMRELMQQIMSQVAELPIEHLNADALEPSEIAEDIGEMQSSMDQVRQMLDAGDIDGALDFLQQLEADMEAMNQQMDPLGAAQPEGLNEFDERMGELMDELNNLEAQEAELEQQTQQLFDEMLAERAEEIRGETERTLNEALERLDDVTRQLESAPRERLSDGAQTAMDGVQDGIESLRELLEAEDVAGAEAASTRLLSQLSDTKWELRRDASMMVRDDRGRRQAERSLQTTTRADEAVRDVRRSMREVMENATPSPGPSQRAALQGLSEQQNQVRERLGEMQGRVTEMAERFPNVQEALQPTLEQTEQAMRGAEADLQNFRPRPGLRNERSALESMQQMRNQMRQLTERQRQREQRNGRRNADNQVEVPEDGESGRAEFRQRVIESMRDPSLQAYEEEIRQYYERLLE